MTVDDFLPLGAHRLDPGGPADPVRSLLSALQCDLVWTAERAVSVDIHRAQNEPDDEDREFSYLSGDTDDALQHLARLIELLALGHTIDWQKPARRSNNPPYFSNGSTIAPDAICPLGRHPLDPPGAPCPLSHLLSAGKRELVHLAGYVDEYGRARRTNADEADALAHRMSATAQRASELLARATELLLRGHQLAPVPSGPALAALRSFKQLSAADWLRPSHPAALCRMTRPHDYGVTVHFAPRKWRQFALACVRRVQNAFTDPRTRALAGTIAQKLDGKISATGRQTRWGQCLTPANSDTLSDTQPGTPEQHAARRAFQALAWNLRCSDAGTAAQVAWWARGATTDPVAEAEAQAHLLRELLGNPFTIRQPATEWLAWNHGTVPALAEGIEKDGAFDRMPILGDALEDAGCTDAVILAHCREPHEHVHGCWVVDLLLGKHLATQNEEQGTEP